MHIRLKSDKDKVFFINPIHFDESKHERLTPEEAAGHEKNRAVGLAGNGNGPEEEEPPAEKTPAETPPAEETPAEGAPTT